MELGIGRPRLGYLAAVEEALDRASLSFSERRAVRQKARGLFRAAISEAFSLFAAENGGTFEDEDGDSDTPIIDFWKWLIESGKIQVFMQFMVKEFLPALFELIIALISALAVI